MWPATYLVYLVASNSAESGFFRHKIYWPLYVAIVGHLATRRRSSMPPR